MSKNAINFSAQYEQEYYTLTARLKELEEELRYHKETVVQHPQGTKIETENVEVVDTANVAELQRTLRMLLTEQERLKSVLEKNAERNSELVTLRSEIEIEKMVTTGQMAGTNAKNVSKHYVESSTMRGNNVNTSSHYTKTYGGTSPIGVGRHGETVVSQVINRGHDVVSSSSRHKTDGVSGIGTTSSSGVHYSGA